jgi:hypothetical protein
VHEDGKRGHTLPVEPADTIKVVSHNVELTHRKQNE